MLSHQMDLVEKVITTTLKINTLEQQLLTAHLTVICSIAHKNYFMIACTHDFASCGETFKL
jgi:hypothetical protein